MIIALPDNEWYPNGSEVVLCHLPFSLEQVEARLGVALARPDVQQRDPAHVLLQLEGYVLRLESVEMANAGVVVSVRGDVQEPGRCLPVLCAALGIQLGQLPWVSSELQPRPWVLYRLDDNGNRVAMWYFREREAAESVARDYAARGHKQLYFVAHAL